MQLAKVQSQLTFLLSRNAKYQMYMMLLTNLSDIETVSIDKISFHLPLGAEAKINIDSY